MPRLAQWLGQACRGDQRREHVQELLRVEATAARGTADGRRDVPGPADARVRTL